MVDLFGPRTAGPPANLLESPSQRYDGTLRIIMYSSSGHIIASNLQLLKGLRYWLLQGTTPLLTLLAELYDLGCQFAGKLRGLVP